MTFLRAFDGEEPLAIESILMPGKARLSGAFGLGVFPCQLPSVVFCLATVHIQ